ncbi:MAG: peptidase M23B [Candidatus Berkelbacteria bacterium Licking1014_7]|uniref:Peptidase M23B n=1 Tax=Candidatus Berkelbacteria bacterium Licking1014_7 TaxID=2017147 RepID=A0A554LKH9_9BACT|nr:MAG: peptidase M23B [Candidatus Berkelbacteria bacterium Licking1014_7]
MKFFSQKTKAIAFYLTIVLVFQVSLAQAVDNSKINDLYKQRETLSRDITRNKQLAEQKKKEAEKINIEIKKIDGDIATTEGRINALQNQIDDIRAKIEEKVLEIRQKEKELAIETDNQSEAIKAIYESTDQSLIYILFSSSDISEIVDRSAYIEALEARIDQTIDGINQIKLSLNQEKEELKHQDDELNDLKKQQEAYKKGLSYQRERKDDLLGQTKNLQKTYEQIVEEARKAYQDVNSELYRITQAARRKASTGGSKKIGNLEFGWPFSGTITAGFGVPTPVQSFHTGIDIDGIIGDPISAAADGEVSFVGGSKTWGYGYYIMINHGSGVSTLYGHLDGFDASVGDPVKRGQRIGFMGNTGFAIAFLGGQITSSHIYPNYTRIYLICQSRR